MRIRKFHGQSVVEFLVSFIIVWAMLLLILGVCALWNMRSLSAYAAIEGACKEASSPGYGVSRANAIVNNMWPGQKVHASEGIPGDSDQPIFLTVQGNFVVSWLVNSLGKFLPNSASVSASAGCPSQKFTPRR